MTLTADLQQLIDQARDVMANAYIPYSNYAVGAVLETVDGVVFTGCNVENASYPAGICAERTALVKAVSEGHRAFKRIVVMTRNAGSPCGICRQMLFEFSPQLQIILADETGTIHYDGSLSDLLPLGFGPSKLEA